MRGRGGFVAVTTLLLAVATGLASLTLWPTYQHPAFVVTVGVTLLVAALIAILGTYLRWSSFIVLLVTGAAYLLLGVPLAVPGWALWRVLPSLEGLHQLVVGTALSWKQLLTISLPVGHYQSLLIPVFLLILVTVVVSLSVALRSRRPDLAVLGPIAVFLAGILLGPDSAQWPFFSAIGVLVAVLVWLIWNRWYRRRQALRLPAHRVAEGGLVGARTFLSAGVILAIAATASFAATHLLPPDRERVVLRTAIAQPFDARQYPSPLGGLRKYEQPAVKNRTVFTVTQLPSHARVRIAALDAYNGVVFSVGQGSVTSASGAFTRVPAAIDQSNVAGTRVRVGITIGDYSGVWLPTVGKLERIDFHGPDSSALLDDFYYNDSSSTAAVVGGLSFGDSYTVTAVLPEAPERGELAELEPAATDLPPVTVVPDGLAARLDRYVSGVEGAGERLVAMIEGLRADGYLSHGVAAAEPASRSGHSADRITELLTSQLMIGDQEQYSVTAALMARQLGFPARVVFGFVPENIDPQTPTAVSGDDVSAWIEVDTTEYGWVAIDPTPPQRPVPDAEPQDTALVAKPQSPVQPQLPEDDLRDTQLPPEASQDQEPLEDPLLDLLLRVAAGLGWASLVMVLLLSPFLTIALAKWRRRRLRRRAATPIERISGGWEEFEDAVLDHGYTPGPTPTRLEIAQVVGGTQPFVLAAVADRAVFSPEEPDAEQARLLWAAVEDLRYMLGSDLSRWERVRALVSLRSLGGYRVTSLFSRGRPKR